jgi:hypothetical protein
MFYRETLYFKTYSGFQLKQLKSGETPVKKIRTLASLLFQVKPASLELNTTVQMSKVTSAVVVA